MPRKYIAWRRFTIPCNPYFESQKHRRKSPAGHHQQPVLIVLRAGARVPDQILDTRDEIEVITT
jgi:hypothetical protein